MTVVATNERGSASLELPLLLGLVIIPFALLVLTIPRWVEHQTAARDAAAEIGRLLVVQPSAAGVGQVDAHELLHRIEQAHGLRAGSLSLVGPPPGSLTPGGAVVVRVAVDLPGPTVPVLGSLGLGSWTAEHTERVPDYAGSFDQ